MQILDVSDNGADIISSYADLSTLLRCPGLVELSLKGSCHYTDRRTHCLSVQRCLPSEQSHNIGKPPTFNGCSFWLVGVCELVGPHSHREPLKRGQIGVT